MNSEDILVSVIVPVFNTVSWMLDECINSILSQTHKIIEIILVDDGSDKECAKYLDAIASEYKAKNNIQVWHKANEGVSAARNYGLKRSSGRYICFVDADDLIHFQYIELLLEACVQFNCMISACSIKEIHSIKDFNLNFLISEKPSWVDGDCICLSNINTSYAVNKLYDRDLALNVLFDENISYYEDCLFSCQALQKSGSCAYVQSILYFYRINGLSLTSFLTADKYYQGILALDKTLKLSFISKCDIGYYGRLMSREKCRVKYMVALINENGKNNRELLKKNIKKFNTNVSLVPRNNADRLIKISLLAMKLPFPIVCIYLKLLFKAKKVKHFEKNRLWVKG